MAEDQKTVPEARKPRKDRALLSLILGLVGIIAWIMPIIGFPITIIGLIFGIRSIKLGKKGISIAGIVLCSIFLLATTINAAIGFYKGSSGQLYNNNMTAINSKNETIQWNVNDLNIESNGNVNNVLKLLEKYDINKLKTEAAAETPSLVMKAPFKYYGKPLKFSGIVSIVQDYPTGSDISNNINNGKETGEIVFICEDGTIIDYLNLGDTGDIVVGDSITIYGFTPGQVEVENKLGGKTTQLVLIGKYFEKASQ